MVNPRDGADASRNKTNEILTVYLVNWSAFIGRIWIRIVGSRKGLEGDLYKRLEGNSRGK